ncbi:protein early flowering 4 [Phtheirospermum japonicum]|uniref:Protein early flowering 4 n=1 Tax=Phtheirospermum japonicum TaxID=374723 RepID=A0A830B1R1_9LAMI|nr:protein early flowering 4 [Phtheirospermum japonicum]
MADSSRTLTAAFAADEDMGGVDGADGEEEEEEPCDLAAWETLTKSFREVQSVLDLNRRLIQQANDNHRSKIPRNLAMNVELIREINANISKVVGLYSDLSESFSGIVLQRRSVAGNSAKGVESLRSRLSSDF